MLWKVGRGVRQLQQSCLRWTNRDIAQHRKTDTVLGEGLGLNSFKKLCSISLSTEKVMPLAGFSENWKRLC